MYMTSKKLKYFLLVKMYFVSMKLKFSLHNFEIHVIDHVVNKAYVSNKKIPCHFLNQNSINPTFHLDIKRQSRRKDTGTNSILSRL